MTNQRPSYLGEKSRSHFVNILNPVRLWLACSDSAFVDADFISCAGIRIKWIWISYERSVDEAGIAWAIASEAIAFEAGFAVAFIVTLCVGTDAMLATGVKIIITFVNVFAFAVDEDIALLAANDSADAVDELLSVFA